MYIDKIATPPRSNPDRMGSHIIDLSDIDPEVLSTVKELERMNYVAMWLNTEFMTRSSHERSTGKGALTQQAFLDRCAAWYTARTSSSSKPNNLSLRVRIISRVRRLISFRK